ncbi:MAG TPA: amino acid ABC transporter permease [Ktedonobacteraceae bacterium]|jgi:His/Glu/Gln/Arg/opine family amino acid ABC transporter permease subunit|nr:amino acid ABC transporter permease [Ktedonobacteraceae bacterium]
MDLAVRAFPAFLSGAINTVLYCISSFPLALLLGLLLSVLSNSRFTWLRVPTRTFIEIIRGTPMIAQIFILYYGIGAILGVYGLAGLINSWTAGIASLAINYAAYEAEVFRAGFLSVDKGQTEAAYSLGLTRGQTFFRIVLPQSIPFMIPPFVNDFIYMLKDSAIVSAIAGTELTSVLNFWATRNSSNPLPLYLIAIVLYLLMSLPTSYVARLFERRLRAAL